MKKNCFKLFLLLLLSGTAFTLQAQDQRQESRQERFEKIRNYKITFLTSKLDLSPEQAQRFWPLYNQYDAERGKLRHQARLFRDDKLSTVPEQELREKLNSRLAAQQDMLDLDKTYMDRFLKVLSVRQVAILYRSEEEFPHILLKKLHADNHPDK